VPGRRRGPAGTLLARSFAGADVRALCKTYADAQSPANAVAVARSYASANAAAYSAADAGAVARSYCATDAVAQQSANAGPLASAYTCSDPRAVAVADARSWQPDGGSSLCADPETDVDANAAADACADARAVCQAYTNPDAATHRGAVARAVGQAYATADAAAEPRAEPAPDWPPVQSERRAYATADGRADAAGGLPRHRGHIGRGLPGRRRPAAALRLGGTRGRRPLHRLRPEPLRRLRRRDGGVRAAAPPGRRVVPDASAGRVRKHK